MKYNLQFFADEEISTGAEVSAPAEQMGTVDNSATTEATEGTTAEGAQTSPTEVESFDRNAFAAQIRRSTEADFQKKIDAEYAKRFGDYTNPETGAKIMSQADYFAALDAQERMKAKAELESKGIDYSVIENIVNNSPKIREAEEVLQRMKTQEINQAIQKDLIELNKLDSSITSLETVPADVRATAESKRITLLDAYMITNFSKVSQQQASAIQQRTINQIAGKAHLAPVGGVVANDGLVDIPEGQRADWEAAFPNLSPAELKKKFNRSLNN